MQSLIKINQRKLLRPNTVFSTRFITQTNLELDFNDSEKAFRTKTSWELLRSYFVFKLCTINVLVDNNKKILSLMESVMGKRIFEYVMRKTVYGHFVAGRDEVDIKGLIQLNRRHGVKSILDYSVEKDVSEEEAKQIVQETLDTVLDQDTTAPTAIDTKYETSLEFADRSDQVASARTYFFTGDDQCDDNVTIIKKSIDASAFCSQKGEGFTAVKLTALGPPQLLMHVSEILNQLENVFQNIIAKRSTDRSNKLNEAINNGSQMQQHNDGDDETPDLSFDINAFLDHLDDLNVELSYDEKLQWFTLIDVNKKNHVDLFEWLNLKNFEHNLANIFIVKDPKTGQATQLIQPLSREGIISMRRMLQRLDEIVQYAKSKDIRVMIDAEQSYLQPAIRRFTLELMRRYNTDNAVVFGTYQCYLKNALDQLSKDLIFSEKEGINFGAKLVRGAYMEQERERARVKEYEDPICDNMEATTKSYYACLNEALNSISKRQKGQVLIMIASHNPDTVKYALKRMRDFKITPDDKLICFGQLLGMCDRITFSLGEMGYSVYKYMPYGPVLDVLPYLSRRALENRSVLNQTRDEIDMISREIRRRIKERQWTRYPPVSDSN